MHRYRHTQTGRAILVAIGLTAVVVAGVPYVASRQPDFGEETVAVVVLLAVLVSLLVPLMLFRSMTVEVGDSAVDVHFGGGLIRKSIPFDRIRAVRTVRYPWYYGLGIRIIPRGTLWNVSGMQAVELELDGGRRFGIGSDEPDELQAAIEDALNMAGDA